MKFTGHESFACRFAWLPKVFREVTRNSRIFEDEENAMVRLGIGKNMVRSIRFWGVVMGVLQPQEGRKLTPTSFGEAIFANEGFDPFLEDIRTLWLLHWKVATRIEDPLFAWDYVLYRWQYPEFTRQEMLTALIRESKKFKGTRSEGTLKRHLDVFLQTYVPSRGSGGPQEDSLDCPLADLELLQVVSSREVKGLQRQESVYAYRREAKPEITNVLFEFCLNDYWLRYYPGKHTLTYRDVAVVPGSVGQTFKLPEDDIRARLEAYAEPNSILPFSYLPSAVQGIVSRRNIEHRDFLSTVYSEEDFNV